MAWWLRRPRGGGRAAAAVLLLLAVAAAAAVGLALRRVAHADRQLPDRWPGGDGHAVSRRQPGSQSSSEDVDAALGLVLAAARHDRAFAAQLRVALSVDEEGSGGSGAEPHPASSVPPRAPPRPASSEPPPRPVSSEPTDSSASGRFTAVLQTYDRPLALLVERVAALAACTHLAAVVIIANADPAASASGHAAPRALSRCGADGRGCWPAFPRPIAVVAEAGNSMNSRFRPRPGLFAAAEAVLLLDDDLAIAPSDLDAGFALWARHPRQLVSFLARAHDPAGPTYIFGLFGGAAAGAYSIGLAGCAFFHRDYLDQYWAPTLAPARALVDRMHNCDDLVLNCLVANATGLPPLVVPANVVAYVPVRANGELVHGMSQGRNWRTERSACLVELQALYGGALPLRWNTINRGVASGGRRDLDQLPHSAVWIDAAAERGYLPAHGHRVGTPDVAAASGCLGRAVRFDAAVAEHGMRLLARPRPAGRALSTTDPWTVEVWAAPEGGRMATSAVVVLSGGPPTQPPVVLGFKEHAGYLAFGNGPLGVLRDPVRLPPDRFAHLAAVFTGRAYRLYVNGRLAAASNATTPVWPAASSSQSASSHSGVAITVAANPTDRPGAAFHGRVQELRIWQRVRTGRELRRALELGYASPSGDGPGEGPFNGNAHRQQRRLPPAGLLAHVPTLHDTLGQFDTVAADPVTLADGLCLAPSTTLLRPGAARPLAAPAVAVVITTYRGRPNNLLRILEHLAAHAPFITEVVVWRNSAHESEGRDGGAEHASLVRTSTVPTPDGSADSPDLQGVLGLFASARVIHAPENLFTEGRYRGCAAARARVCYVLDDDFVPTGVHGLLASYLRAPRLLHVVTDTHTALLNHHWTYVNEAAAAQSPQNTVLHAGFAWLGAGAMLARATAERFLRQMDRAGLDAEARAHADLYMAVWMNRLPVVTTVVLNTTGLEQGSAHSCATCTHARARNVHHLQQAVRLLPDAGADAGAGVGAGDGDDGDEMEPSEWVGSDPLFPPGQRRPGTHVDEACARAVYRSECVTDRCTFITNIQSWPCVVNPSFDLDAHLVAQTSRDNLTVPFNDALQFIHAVDGDPATVWRPARDLRPGDYVGLDLRRPTVLEGVRVQGKPGDRGLVPPAVAWEVTVDGVHWDGLLQSDGSSGDDDDDDHGGEGAVHAAGVTHDAATGTTLLALQPARVQGVRFVLTQPWSGPLRISEMAPLFWTAPAPTRARPPLARVAYVVDGVLDPATASAETRALVDEAVVAAASGLVAEVTVLVPGRRGRPAPDALEQLVPGGTAPARPRLVVVPPSNVSYTVAPADAVALRIALDLLDWFRAAPPVADVVIFAVYQSPMLHVLRAHQLGTLAPSTVFAARAWRRTATDDLALHGRFASGPLDLLHIFLEESALALADCSPPVPMAGAALGAHVRASNATAAPAAAVVRSVQILAVTTPSTADADWHVLIDAASRLPAEVQARLSLLGTALPPSTLLQLSVPVAPVPARTWRDVLAYAAAAPAARVLWILDRSATATYWEAAAVAAGASVADRGNGTVSTALEVLGALAATLPSPTTASASSATPAADVALLRRSLHHAAADSDLVRATLLELHATRASLVPRPQARAAAAAALREPTSTMPRVTVCVPVYGRTDYLDATLASLLASTYPPDRLHVVIADDGSTADADVRYLDALSARVAGYAGTWTVLRLPHRSAPAARNAAIARATTASKYVLMFDSDDLLRPDALVHAVAAAERTHADVVVGWAQTFRERDDAEAATGALPVRRRGHVWAAAGVDAALGMFGNAFGGGSALFLRSALEGVGGYRMAPPGTAHLDYELLARIVLAGGRLVLLPEVLYDYRAGARGSIFASSSSTHANQRFSLGAYQLAYPHLAGVFEVAFATVAGSPPGAARAQPRARPQPALDGVPPVLAEVGLWLYINLAHRVDRLANVREQLRAVGVPPERSVRIDAVRHRWPAVGCAQSHLAALDRASTAAAADRGRWVAILEDDFAWAPDAPATAVAAALTDRPEFDVLLGAPHVRTLQLDPTDTGGNGSTVRVLKAQSALLYIVRTGYLPTLRANVAEGAARLEEAAAAWEATPADQRNDTRFDRTYAVDQYWKRLMPEARWITAFPALGRHWTSFSDIEGRVYGDT